MNLIESPTDYVTLGGVRAPVLCDVQGAQLKRTFKINRGLGVSGGAVRYVGDELCEFKIVFRLYTVADWDAWEAFAAEQQALGDWKIPVDFLEYRPPKPVLMKMSGAQATPVDEQDPVESKIAAMYNDIQKLAAGP